MKLLCTIQQGELKATGDTTLNHRIYFDFLTRIGLDGRDGTTPPIGPDGNWWLGSENTGVPATVCRSYRTYADFPATGQVDTLYLDKDADKLYRWDAGNHRYRVIGKHYDQIAITDGRTA